MKARVCFVPKSFDFSEEQESLISSIKASSDLIEKYLENDGFISFSKSSDFDTYAAIQLFRKDSKLDSGAIMAQLYDHNMGKADTLNSMSETEIEELVNTVQPELESTWLSLYSSNSEVKLSNCPNRTVYDSGSLVDFCTEVLVDNPRSHNEYAQSFVQIYKNLIFLDYPDHKSFKTFNSIRKITGGYQSFIKGITDCLSYMDKYTVIPNDSQRNIDILNAQLEFPVTPEGSGKNERKIKALKRDFYIDGVEYTTVNCEFHYKLERIDGANGNGTYHFNRIYFGFFNRIDRNNPKIAIAHIGEHL